MFDRKKQPEETGWLPIADCAQAFDLTPQGFAKSIRPLIPPSAVRSAGKRGTLIHCRSAIDAFAAAKAAKSSADPMDGTISPALERWRQIRCEDAELDLLVKQRKLVDHILLRRAMEPGIRLMRNMGHQLENRYGTAAGDMYREAITEYWNRTREALKRLAGGSDETEETKADDRDAIDRPDGTRDANEAVQTEEAKNEAAQGEVNEGL